MAGKRPADREGRPCLAIRTVARTADSNLHQSC